jgi:hypothetical protein
MRDCKHGQKWRKGIWAFARTTAEGTKYWVEEGREERRGIVIRRFLYVRERREGRGGLRGMLF